MWHLCILTFDFLCQTNTLLIDTLILGCCTKFSCTLIKQCSQLAKIAIPSSKDDQAFSFGEGAVGGMELEILREVIFISPRQGRPSIFFIWGGGGVKKTIKSQII